MLGLGHVAHADADLAGGDPASSRDQTRAHLVEAAAKLLATGGPDAVTTRSVALAAGLQAPTIYRRFGDKNGLLAAVAEHGFTTYMARKAPDDPAADPVQNLHACWDLHIGFGLANPELFRLMHTVLSTPDGQAAAAAGAAILRARVAPGGRGRTAARDRAPGDSAHRQLLIRCPGWPQPRPLSRHA